MKQNVLAIIIALLSGAIVSLLLLPIGFTHLQLWIVFLSVTLVCFTLFWVFGKFMLEKDIRRLEILVENLSSGEKINLPQVRLQSSRRLLEGLVKLYAKNRRQIDGFERQSTLRKRFIADISHELKSPMFSAQGYVHTLLDGAIKDKAVRHKFLKKAARNLDYMDVLIQDLLTLSQIESETIQMQPEQFDIITLIDEVIDDRESKAEKAGIRLASRQINSPLTVYADYARIRQVLVNLVNNAINYSYESGTVLIEGKTVGKKVEISVIDQGVGIEEKYHERIFNRFFRIDKSRTVKSSTGLGLAIVKHILERHNANISVKSSPGNGSTFSFALWTNNWENSESTR